MRLAQNAALGPLTVLILLSFPLAAHADKSDVLRLRGETAAAAGDCAKALPLLAQARAANPSDARAALVAGKCQTSLGQYREALASLESAQAIAPDPEINLYLGIAKYHLEEYDAAAAELDKARADLPDRAELHLYTGMLELRREQDLKAAESLARAGQADPNAVEPIASFYEGIARGKAGDFTRAEFALRRAAELGKGTVWEKQALAALEQIEGGNPPAWKSVSPFGLEVLNERSTRWWATATVGFEYDNNVVLRGTGVNFPDLGSGDDERGVYWAEVGWEPIATRDWTVGISASYYGTAHDTLEEFDSHYPELSAWVDHRLGEQTVARVQYDFGYAFLGDAWVGDAKEFLRSHTWTPAIYHNWGTPGNTRLFSRIGMRNFRFDTQDVAGDPGPEGSPCAAFICGPAFLDEGSSRNRDGVLVESGFDHILPILEESVIFRLGFRYHKYFADGKDYDYDGYEVQVGGRTLLPYNFAFEVFGSYMWQPYDNASSFADPSDQALGRQYRLGSNNRHDELARVDVSLERPIWDYVTLATRYSYLNNSSNVDVFDYDRHIVGVYATFRLSPR